MKCCTGTTLSSDSGIGIETKRARGPFSASPVLVTAGTEFLLDYLKSALPVWVDSVETCLTTRWQPLSGTAVSQETVVLALTSRENTLQQFLNEAFAGGRVHLVITVDTTAADGSYVAEELRRDQGAYRRYSSMEFEPQMSLESFQAWVETRLLLSSALSRD